MKLDVGCGPKLKKGWTGIDNDSYRKYNNPNIIQADLNERLPIKSNTVTHIKSSHVFEHIQFLETTLKELKRVAKNGCEVHFIVPHFTSNTFEFHVRAGFRYNFFKDLEWLHVTSRRINFTGAYRFMNFINKYPKIIALYEGSFLRSFFFATEVELRGTIKK